MSNETLNLDPPRRRTFRLAKLSLAVTAVAAAWFGIELAIATSWQDAMVLHDAGFAIASIAGLLALISFRDGTSRRRTSWTAAVLAGFTSAFYLFILPL